MTTWIVLAVLSQFFYACVALIDKYVVTSGRVAKPLIYAYYVTLFSSLSILVFIVGLLPLPEFFDKFQIPSLGNVSIPTFEVVYLSIAAAFSFLFALVSLFSAFKRADASDVVPVVNSANAVTTLVLSFLFLGGILTHNFVWGFSLLVIGTLLVSLFRFDKKTLFFTLIAGTMFSIHFILMKTLFNVTVFDNAFFWSRIAITLSAFSLWIVPSCCSTVKNYGGQKVGFTNFLIILGSKVVGGIAGILTLKAIQLGEISIVQALQALQFAFLLMFALIWGNKVPYACGENCNRHQKLQKIISVFVIMIGFFLLFI